MKVSVFISVRGLDVGTHISLFPGAGPETPPPNAWQLYCPCKWSYVHSNRPPQSFVSGGHDDLMWKQDVPIAETPYFSIAPHPPGSLLLLFVCVSMHSVLV